VTREEALRWAEQWVADWNARDLAAVLGHFEDGIEFTSPRALAVVGVGTVRGKDPLRAYWTQALAAIASLRFNLRRIAFDPATSELAIFYDRDVDGRLDRAAEVLRFGSSGRVVRAEVYHGLLP
jgi:steroid delta-isomerase